MLGMRGDEETSNLIQLYECGKCRSMEKELVGTRWLLFIQYEPTNLKFMANEFFLLSLPSHSDTYACSR